MNAGDCNVEASDCGIVKVDTSVGVEDIDFASEHQADTIHLARYYVHVGEINLSACAGNRWCVLSDSENSQTAARGFGGHFLNGAVGVAADDGVGVEIGLNDWHNDL